MSDTWRTDAACIGHDPSLWFPERGQDSRPGKAICAACPVRVQCLEAALDAGEAFGTWGGMSEKQRRVIRVQRRREERAARPVPVKRVAEPRPPSEHGTYAGYYRLHRSRGEKPCDACRIAKNAAQQARRRRVRAA